MFNSTLTHRSVSIAALIAASALPPSLHAQSYPDRQIRMIVPLAAGGSTDVVARTAVVPALSEALGRPVVVENITGASGQVAYETLARAKPDGYTIMMATVSLSTMKLTNKSFALDPVNDFAPVTRVESRPLFIAVPIDFQPKSIPDFVAYARANPGKLNYGAGGALDILAAHWLARVAGIQTAVITYRGGAPALQAAAAGDVHFTWNVFSVAKPFVDAKKLRLLAMSGAKRSSDAPDIPAVAETYPEYVWASWTGIIAPKGTPREVVDRLFRAANDGLSKPESRERFTKMGTTLDLSQSPADFARAIQAETNRWARIMADAKITFE